MKTLLKKISTLNFSLMLLGFMFLSSHATADELSSYGITSTSSCSLVLAAEDKKKGSAEEEPEPECE